VQATQKNEIKPWQVKTWCIATPSARFVAKMEDVLDVYARDHPELAQSLAKFGANPKEA